jgi:hypothetical protein
MSAKIGIFIDRELPYSNLLSRMDGGCDRGAESKRTHNKTNQEIL